MKLTRSILLLLLNISVLMAQEKPSASQSRIIIVGETLDSSVLSNVAKKQKLLIFTSSFSSNVTIAPFHTYEFLLGRNSPFKMVLPTTSTLTYVSFSIKGGKLAENYKFSAFDNTYILENGDSVYCKISDRNIVFYGKGKDKLNCQSEIYNLNYVLNDDENKLLDEKRYDEYFNLTNRRKDSILNLQLQVIDKYTPKLGRKMAEIMIANCFGLRYYSYLKPFSFFSTLPSNKDEYLGYVKNKAYQSIDTTLINKIDENTLILSPIYCNFLLEKIIVDNSIDSAYNLTSNSQDSKIEMVFNSIKRNYHGLIREKLFTLFFLRYVNNKTSLGLIDQGLGYIRNSEYRKILLEKKHNSTQGSPFYNFELKDTNGNIVRLQDFNKKIVILDFWYTGCSNCVTLYKGMRRIINKYRNNDQVAFVSISVDKNIAQWLNSVESGKYADPSGINLYTNGLGVMHPLIEKNNIFLYPTQYILKYGKIFSISPPRPGPSLTDQRAIDATNAFISLVEEALADLNI